MRGRLIEIDALRGLAIALMLGYHFLFDLVWLDFVDMDLRSGLWSVLARTVLSVFLLLVGVSVALSRRGFKGQLARGAKIFGLGMLVSLATWWVMPQEYVRFGVLHLIGVAVPLVVLAKGRLRVALGLAAALILAGVWASFQVVESAWLLPFGLVHSGFSSVDYVPLLPWLALPFVGVVLGESFYARGGQTPLIHLAKIPGLQWMGRRSLWIYLVHQPVFFGCLSLLALS